MEHIPQTSPPNLLRAAMLRATLGRAALDLARAVGLGGAVRPSRPAIEPDDQADRRASATTWR